LLTAGKRIAEPDYAAPESLAPKPDEHWPFYADDEIGAVVEVLRSGKVNQWTGPHVGAFETAMAQRFGGGPGVALANGSLALELALRAYDVGPGDEVVVTPRTFMASASCVRQLRPCGGLLLLPGQDHVHRRGGRLYQLPGR
jgi:hypothetical protein